jgi:hypothetical protein
MPGSPVRFGPFTQGLNRLSDPAAIEDTELVEALNFELDLDGSLISRPPVASLGPNAAFDSRLLVIGLGIFNGIPYALGATTNAIWYYASGTWTQITTGLTSYTAIQWKDNIWFISAPGSSKGSGYWNPSAPTTYTPVVGMPNGYTAVVHKNRMFISSGILALSATGARVDASSPSNPNGWVGNGGAGAVQFDVNAGDGQSISRMVVFNDNIMIFKQESTYFFAYDTDPGLGQIRKVSNVIGAANKFAVGDYENNLYVFHQNNVYEVVNTDFSRMNLRVPFELDAAGGTYDMAVFLCVVDERLLVRYYNYIYVFNLRTRTWTRWQSTRYFGPLQVIPKDLTGDAQNTFIAGSCLVGTKNWYTIFPAYTASAVETFTCTAKTKNFDMSVGHKFKRMYWWGADVASVNSITGSLTPVVYSFAATWGDLSTSQWGALTVWGQPLATPSVVSTAVATLSAARRRFIKFPKALRFRQVNFQVDLTTDGSLSTGPVRLFNITGLMAEKETVSAQVS